MSPSVAAGSACDHALKARQAKRATAEEIGIDARFISDMVERFYASIRADELLGPIFAERVADWLTHLERMKQFWRSVLHNSGEFSGNPMVKHIAIPVCRRRILANGWSCSTPICAPWTPVRRRPAWLAGAPA
ncbi:MAG: group III truncated hemoglobin [Gammaproteobacteria bacterium]|nr:group III truncated hemoglobin [Gammaproteobacteria bacterium]